jgi:small-conductance mechanosensitive channel
VTEILATVREYFTAERVGVFARAAVIVFVGFVIARFAGRWSRITIGRRGDPQRAELVGRLVNWTLAIAALAAALQELGFKLGVLLGAAGVFTVAVGFASQTTLSNLISGFFLFGERPFSVGDMIEVEGVTGEVLSVDMMSTKLRALDNRYVRIPNEAIVKTKVVNLTRFPIRRTDLRLAIARDENFVKVRDLLLAIADRNPLALDEPSPQVTLEKVGELSLEIQLSAWGETARLDKLRAALSAEVQEGLLSAKVKLPLPMLAAAGQR